MDALREYSPSDDEEVHVINQGKKADSSTEREQESQPKPIDLPVRKDQDNKNNEKTTTITSESDHGDKQRWKNDCPTSPRKKDQYGDSQSRHHTHSSDKRSGYRRDRSPSHRRHRSRSPHTKSRHSYHSSDKRRRSSDKTQDLYRKETSSSDTSQQRSQDSKQKSEKVLTPNQSSEQLTLPSYLNPGAVNPKQFQSTLDKRKLLWSKSKKTDQSWNNWESASFEGDVGGETQSKFRRLMGIKSTSSETKTADETTHKGTTLLRNLESQYETSRVMTHLAKGAGLGYGVSSQITQTEVNPTDTDSLHE